MLVILYISLTDDDKIFSLKEKTIFLLTFFITLGITSLPLYLSFTQVGAMHIDGYQARYIFPILPLALMCLSNKKIKTIDNKNRTMNLTIIYSMLIVLSLAQLILVK